MLSSGCFELRRHPSAAFPFVAFAEYAAFVEFAAYAYAEVMIKAAELVTFAVASDSSSAEEKFVAFVKTFVE